MNIGWKNSLIFRIRRCFRFWNKY